MKCMSCNEEIPPAWVACIQENKCPGCAGPIMNEASKVLLDELRDAMSRMPNDPEGLSGWLLSNYVLRKVGSAEPTNFHRQSKAKHYEEEQDSDDPNSVNYFLKRSAAKDVPSKKYIKKLKDKSPDSFDMQEISNQINNMYTSDDEIEKSDEDYYEEVPQISEKDRQLQREFFGNSQGNAGEAIVSKNMFEDRLLQGIGPNFADNPELAISNNERINRMADKSSKIRRAG